MWTLRFQEALRELRATLNRGWINEVEEAASHSRGYLTKVFAGKQAPDAETLFALLDHPLVDAQDFLTAVGLRLDFAPLSYLARIPRQGRCDLLLQQLEQAAGQLSPDATPTASLLRDLHDLEALRFSDAKAARKALPSVIEDCTTSASYTIVGRALTVYAEDRRIHTQFGLAARALTCALKSLPVLCPETPVTLQRTGYLLADHGWLKAAERCAKEACDLCVQMHDQNGIGRMLFTRAVMVDRQGDMMHAFSLYRNALGYLAEKDWTYRSAAHHALAWCHSQSGQCDDAARELESAVATHCTRQGVNWLKIIWLQGIVALRRDKTLDAETRLRQACAGFEQGHDPLTTALVSLDLCKALLCNRKLPEVREVAGNMIALLTPLRRNRIASATIVRFRDMVQQGNVTLRLIEKTIQRIEGSERPEAAPAPQELLA